MMIPAVAATTHRPCAVLGSVPRWRRGPRAAADGSSRGSASRFVDVEGIPKPKVTRRFTLTAVAGAAAASRGSAPATASIASTSEVVRRAADIATNGAGASTVAFDDASVTIDGTGQVVPVAVWYPTDATSSGATPTYPHAISVAKIARVLLNLPESTPRFLDRDFPLAPSAGIVSSSAKTQPSKVVGAVVLCHGYLGSRFDLVDLAEALAASGFLVAAPEFAESLATPTTTSAQTRPGAEPAANPSATRDVVLNAVLRDVIGSGRFNTDTEDGDARTTSLPVALVGQSAGASTATSAPGRFAARVAIAGFRPPPSEEPERREALLGDPLLVVASAGDGVISLYPTDGGAFGPYRGIKAEVESLPASFARLDAGGLLESTRGGGTPPRTAFVTYEEDAGDASSGALPCHISFLSSRTNDAMVDVLSPLLPLARVLGVPVLDFDRYQVTRDSDEVNSTLVPAVTAWLASTMR